MTYNPTTRRVGWLNNANPANFDLVDFVNAKGSGSPAKGYVDVIKAFDWNPQTVGKRIFHTRWLGLLWRTSTECGIIYSNPMYFPVERVLHVSRGSKSKFDTKSCA